MKIHPRVREAQTASSALALFWFRSLDQLGLGDYGDAYVVWNQIDRFWIDAARQGLSTKEARAAWKNADHSKLELPAAVQSVGDELVRLVKEHGLTYGEITGALLDIRMNDAKSYLQSERHPGKPDKPSGLA